MGRLRLGGVVVAGLAGAAGWARELEEAARMEDVRVGGMEDADLEACGGRDCDCD